MNTEIARLAHFGLGQSEFDRVLSMFLGILEESSAKNDTTQSNMWMANMMVRVWHNHGAKFVLQASAGRGGVFLDQTQVPFPRL